MSAKNLVLTMLVMVPLVAHSATETPQTPQAENTLEKQLEGLNLPTNSAPVNASTAEKIYSVQERYITVNTRTEFTLGYGMNFTGDSFVDSAQLNAGFKYHFNDKWSAVIGGSYVYNALSGAGKRLLDMEKLVPDVNFVKYRASAMAVYNLFYGKFRVSMDQVFYFDQYLALGPGMVWMESGSAPAAVGDVGFAFWFGRRFNAQLGLKDFFYNQKRVLSSSMVHDLVGHFELGILLGGDRS